MFDELFARRQRMQKKLGPRLGGLIEFVLFSGLVMGLFALLYGGWYGVAPILAFMAGYALLDRSRQSALAAAGADEPAIRKRHDRLALILFAALAVAGAASFYVAMGAHYGRRAAALAAEPAPERTLDLDMVR
ncbi:MAG: hypothetical protein AB7M12_07195 [Hyphomonadaceae bacterium]